MLELLLPAGATATADGKPTRRPAGRHRRRPQADRDPPRQGGREVRRRHRGRAPRRCHAGPAGSGRRAPAGAGEGRGRRDAAPRPDQRRGRQPRRAVHRRRAGRPRRRPVGHGRRPARCGRSPVTRRPSCRSPSAPTASSLVSGSADATADPVGRRDRRAAADLQGPHRGGRVGRVQPGRRSGSSPGRRTGRRSSGTRKPASWSTRSSSKGILGVAYSPDGATLATASADRTATLWDAETGKQNVRAAGPPGGRHLRRLQPGRPARRHRVVRRHSASSGTWPPASASSEPGGTATTSTRSRSPPTAGASSPASGRNSS